MFTVSRLVFIAVIIRIEMTAFTLWQEVKFVCVFFSACVCVCVFVCLLVQPDESSLDFSSCILRHGIKNAKELACGVCLLNVDARSKVCAHTHTRTHSVLLLLDTGYFFS